jgi:hypothetical protein
MLNEKDTLRRKTLEKIKKGQQGASSLPLKTKGTILRMDFVLLTFFSFLNNHK